MPSVDHSIDVGSLLGATLDDFKALYRDAESILSGIRRALRRTIANDWPDDTGISKQSWELRVEGLVVILRNPVEYASYVHQAGDDTIIADFLEAEIETLVAAALPALRRLLARAKQLRPSKAAKKKQTASKADLKAGLALFKAQASLFKKTGARERLRERFPDEPIGRARTRGRARRR